MTIPRQRRKKDAGPVLENQLNITTEDLVLEWAHRYAQLEKAWEIEVGSFGFFRSRSLDRFMMADVYLNYGNRRRHAIRRIAQKYGADEDRLIALNLSIEETEKAAKSGKYQLEAENERTHSQEG